MEKQVLVNTPFVKKLQNLALLFIVLGLAGSIYAAVVDYQHFMLSYLISAVLFTGISLASLFFVMIQFVTRAGWSVLLRRIPEFFSAFVPVIPIVLLPILYDVWIGHSLFEWTHREVVASDPILQSKEPYLNPLFFTIRTVLYVGVWLVIYRVIIGNSLRQDEHAEDYTPTEKNIKRSAPFIVLYGLTLTFFAFDYLMSLQPHWYSTIFGVYTFASTFLGAIALIVVFLVILKEGGYLPDVTVEHYHNTGKFLFAFTVFWAYIAFSQYFLIWYGNIPEETLFYLRRYGTGWIIVSWALLFVHFIIPFVLLLPQKSKRNPKMLVFVASLILLITFFEIHWVAAAAHYERFVFGIAEIATLLLLGGIFLWMTARKYRKYSVVPVNDPYIEESKEAISWGNVS